MVADNILYRDSRVSLNVMTTVRQHAGLLLHTLSAATEVKYHFVHAPSGDMWYVFGFVSRTLGKLALFMVVAPLENWPTTY